jgi:hypothetical protein
VTFISIHSVIICVVFFGACMRCTRLCSLKPGVTSMHLRTPFIAPRQLGAIGGQQGRPSLPSVELRTRQSGAPPDSHCRRSSVDLLPFLAQMTVAAPGRLAHRTLSGAHQTVRCTPDSLVPPADRWSCHASCEDCAADHWRRRPLAHRTVRCTTGQSGEF